jgi:hypothetical protein
MKSKTTRTSITLALLAGCCGASGASGAYAQAVVEKNEIRIVDQIYQILDQDMVKITFDEGSSTLSNSSMTAIADFVKATKDESKVERYLVASWSDKEFPTKGELSSSQRKLAASRAERIKSSLSAAGAAKIDTFEMTKQPNWIQRAFSTETAEIKNKGMSATHDEKLLKEIGQRLRNNGGPHTAVIIAKFKNEVLSH